MIGHTVYDFRTIRWLERHHNQKKISIQNLDENRIKQLKEMFNHLDRDGSETIEVYELQQAMADMGLDDEQQRILEVFHYMGEFRVEDSDHSGSIDFEEFISVMTSDMMDQEFFQLEDEKEAQKWNLAFFLFATSYRRIKLVEAISKDDQSDSERYQHFHKLFNGPKLPTAVENGSDSSYAEMKKNHSIIKKKIVTPKLKQAISKMGKRSNFARSKLLKIYESDKQTPKKSTAPFHMHRNFVPRNTLGNYENGKWKMRNDPGAKTDAWNLLKNRSVLLETKLKSEAIREAKKILLSNSTKSNKLQRTPEPPKLTSHHRTKMGLEPRPASGLFGRKQSHRKYTSHGRRTIRESSNLKFI